MNNLLRSLFRTPTGFGTAGMRRHREEGSVTVLGSGNAQYGVEVPETGGSIKNFTVRYFLEIDVPILDNVGEVRGRVKSDKVSREVTMEFEVLDNTGIMSFDFLSACVPANDVDDFGDGSGDLLMQEVTIIQQRAEWRMGNIRLLSNPGLEL